MLKIASLEAEQAGSFSEALRHCKVVGLLKPLFPFLYSTADLTLQAWRVRHACMAVISCIPAIMKHSFPELVSLTCPFFLLFYPGSEFTSQRPPPGAANNWADKPLQQCWKAGGASHSSQEHAFEYQGNRGGEKNSYVWITEGGISCPYQDQSGGPNIALAQLYMDVVGAVQGLFTTQTIHKQEWVRILSHPVKFGASHFAI